MDELMRTATNPYLPISANIMRKYVASLAILKTMMHMLIDELDRGSREMYPDAMEARFRFQMDVTVKHTNTLKYYQSWHQYATDDHLEDVEEFDFHGCLSHSDV